MKKKALLWVIIPAMFMVIMYGQISQRKDRDIRSEYSDILYLGNVAGVVSDDFFIKWGATYIILNGAKIKVPQSFNHEIEPYNFCYFLMIGDSIKKKWGSEYVILQRNNVEYTFKIGDHLYREKPRYIDY